MRLTTRVVSSRSCSVLLAILAACAAGGCADDPFDSGDSSELPPSVTGGIPGHGRAAPYESCTSRADCGAGTECVPVLGARICTVVGCATGAPCPGAGLCVDSPALDARGVCTRVGGDPVCGRRCRDVLTCNLDPECNQRGCCSELDARGCPTSCTALDAMECEVAPQCPVACCE